mmetsp:Transcript_12556/g.36596  ORF Transcript_12556/g.36596 Transcript_12556/m.36596 type:complete len:219 (+) Transcript_12556:495-1151(+)
MNSSCSALLIASATGTVCRPLVSPWKEMMSHSLPSLRALASTASRSPPASRWPPARSPHRAGDTSLMLAGSKTLLETIITEFWSRIPPCVSGVTSVCVCASEESLKWSLKTPATSCRHMMSTLPYVSARIWTVRTCLCRKSRSQIVLFTTCHSSSGDKRFMRCTTMASKMAWHRICRGIESRSSCSVTAGYLLRGIGSSIWTGRSTAQPSFVRTVSAS